MDNTRWFILLGFAALCLLSVAFGDCNATSSSPNFSIGIDFLSSDNPVDDENVVAHQLVKETNPDDVEKLLKTIENEHWFNQGFVDKEVSKACKEYAELDEKVVSHIEKGGKDRSSKQTKWARGRFDAWRRHFKKELPVSPETPIEVWSLVGVQVQSRKKWRLLMLVTLESLLPRFLQEILKFLCLIVIHFTNEMLEELMETTPNLRHYFPRRSVQLNNFGGQSFFGATFNNCTFVLPDSSARTPLLDKTNVISK